MLKNPQPGIHLPVAQGVSRPVGGVAPVSNKTNDVAGIVMGRILQIATQSYFNLSPEGAIAKAAADLKWGISNNELLERQGARSIRMEIGGLREILNRRLSGAMMVPLGAIMGFAGYVLTLVERGLSIGGIGYPVLGHIGMAFGALTIIVGIASQIKAGKLLKEKMKAAQNLLTDQQFLQEAQNRLWK